MFVKSKKEKRLESRCKKMAALLNIKKLNEQDKKMHQQAQTSAESVIAAVKQQVQELIDKKLDNSNPQREHLIKEDFKIVNRKHSSSEIIANEEPLKKSKLSNEEYYAKLKGEIKELNPNLSHPNIRLKFVGENAVIKDNSDTQKTIPIFLSDLQHLILYSLLGFHSPYVPSRWCHLEKYNKISHTVILVMEGLTVEHFIHYKSSFPHINLYFQNHLEIITPSMHGGSIAEELSSIPLTGTQKQKIIEKFGSLKAAMQSTGDIVKLLKSIFPITKATTSTSMKIEKKFPLTDKFSRTQLLLSPWQLFEENYPISMKGDTNKYADYVFTQDEYLEATAESPMFGLDCEMCKTVTGALELTRVSIVDEKLNLIYDTLVKPDNEIADYLTQYSGITPKMLENIQTKLSDVQEFIKVLIPADAILVGQSLNADLHCLKMMHPYIIDTSVIYNITGDRHRKSKLQTLAREFLDERIQEKKSGHCSTEDAQASLKLVKLKLANSIDFGDAVLINQKKLDSITSNKKFSSKVELSKFTKINNVPKKSSKSTAIVGCNHMMNEYSQYLKSSSLNLTDNIKFEKSDNIHIIVEKNNDCAIKKTSEILMEQNLTYCHLKIEDIDLNNDFSKNAIEKVDKWVGKIWNGTALNGLVCVLFGGEKNFKTNGACFLGVKNQITNLTNV